jgi:hypothetical protein
MIEGILATMIDSRMPEKAHFSTWDWTGLEGDILNQFGVRIRTGELGELERRQVEEEINQQLTKRYQENDFNETLATVSFGPRYRFDWGFIGLYALGEAHWVADEDQNTSLGGMFSLGLNLSPADLFFTDVSCSNRYFNDDWQNTNLTYQDGHICSVTARLDHHLSSQSFMRVLGGAGQERTGRDYLDNDFWSAGAGIYQEWGWGISLYLQGLYTRKDFDGISPGITEGRRDDRIDASVNLTKRDFVLMGMAPMMQYTYTHNISNVPFYQFDAHSVNLTLTKKF